MNDVIYSDAGLPQVAPAHMEPRTSVAPVAISAILGRIEEAIDTETQSIGSPAFDIRASNARKSRYLYDLNRALKGVGPAELAQEHREGIVRLRSKLVANEAAIRAHLAAVNEVATLIQDAIQRAEADGTYSSAAFQKGEAA